MSQLPILPLPDARRSRRALRPGVTLLELLVVVAVLAVATAAVAPLVRPPAGESVSPAARVRSQARAAAVRRGEPVRLRIAQDGVWALVAARTGEPIGSGRVDGAERSATIELLIDALGNCVPTTPDATPGAEERTAASFDPLRCEETGR